MHKPNGKAAGCLVDWDLACCPDYRGDGEALRRGAGPFVAIDLQYVRSNGKLEPQAHHYHHDLESLFWLLAWALMHFDILAMGLDSDAHGHGNEFPRSNCSEVFPGHG